MWSLSSSLGGEEDSDGRGGTESRRHLRVVSVTRATRAQFKTAGNKALQAKNFDEAIAQYTKARRASSRAGDA